MKKSLLWKHLLASIAFSFLLLNCWGQYDVPSNYPTIQAAINAAPAGSTINVASGTYNESNIIVDKALTIQGASRKSVIIAPAITDDHIDGGFATPVSNGFVIRHSDVTIESLTIDGNGNHSLTGSQNYRQGVITDYFSGHYNNSVVTDVSFKNIWRRGLNYYVNDGSPATTGNVLSHSYFDNIGTDPALSGNGFALFFAQSSGTILDNHITNCNQGIVTNFINQWPSYAPVINISHNTISSLISGDYGAEGMNLSGLSSSSTITSNSVNLTGCDNTKENIGAQIYYTSAFPNSTDQLLLDNNTVTAAGTHDIGIEVSRQSFGNPSIPPVIVSNNTANGNGATGFLFTDLPSGYGPGAGDAVNATAIGNTANGFTTDFKIQSLDGKVVTVTATNNFIIDGTDGIELDGLNIYTTLNYNSITGQSGYAINAASYTGSPVNATCNWYGTNDASLIATKISGPVTYIPWLTNGKDASGDPGFQPVPNSCNGPIPYCDKKKGDDVIMCHNGKPECVKLKDVQKNLDHGWTLGPCTQASCGTGETLMCHNGQTECVNNKDVQKEKKEGWNVGSCSNGGGDGENDRTGNTSNIAINPKSGISLPVVYKLSNYPNPFVGTSTIKYELPFDSKVSIKVYDLMGRVVTTLVDADKKAGSYTVDFKASAISSGSLYYRIIAKSKDKQFEQTNKMTQLK
jgi:hypothetical protein